MTISTYNEMFYMYEKLEGTERFSDGSVNVLVPNEIKPESYRVKRKCKQNVNSG